MRERLSLATLPIVITLYRAPFSTNVERVALALAHKGLEVESVVIDYSDRRPVEEVSGQELVPVIEDGDTVVNDSVAILRHLEERYPEPALFPSETARRAELDVFLDWFEREWKLPPNAIEEELDGPSPDTERIAGLAGLMDERLDLFERMLTGRDHLFGELSAADFYAFPFLKYARSRDAVDDELFHRVLDEHQSLGSNHPRLAAWIERIDAIPRLHRADPLHRLIAHRVEQRSQRNPARERQQRLELEERFEHEAASRDLRMGKHQALGPAFEVTEQQQVHVDGPRAVTHPARDPAQVALDLLADVEQLLGCQLGVYRQDRVEEVLLVGHVSLGCRLVHRRGGGHGDARPPVERVAGRAQGGQPVALVRAQAQVAPHRLSARRGQASPPARPPGAAARGG